MVSIAILPAVFAASAFATSASTRMNDVTHAVRVPVDDRAVAVLGLVAASFVVLLPLPLLQPP